jgi:hypothetical protein
MSEWLVEDYLVETACYFVPLVASVRRQPLGIGLEALVKKAKQKEGPFGASGCGFRELLEQKNVFTVGT